jgi:hypothetical protein
MFKPIWATNVLGARFIKNKLDRSTPPESTTEVGHFARRMKKNVENDAKYKV